MSCFEAEDIGRQAGDQDHDELRKLTKKTDYFTENKYPQLDILKSLNNDDSTKENKTNESTKVHHIPINREDDLAEIKRQFEAVKAKFLNETLLNKDTSQPETINQNIEKKIFESNTLINDDILAVLDFTTAVNDAGSEKLIASISPEDSEEEVESVSFHSNGDEIVRKAKEEYLRKQREEEEENKRRELEREAEIESLIHQQQMAKRETEAAKAKEDEKAKRREERLQKRIEDSVPGLSFPTLNEASNAILSENVSTRAGISILQGPVNIYLNHQSGTQKIMIKSEYRKRYRTKFTRFKRKVIQKMKTEHLITLSLSTSSDSD